MEFFIQQVNRGRERRVSVEQRGGKFFVTLDGAGAVEAGMEVSGPDSFSLVLSDGRCFEASLDWLSREEVMVSLFDGVYPLRVVDVLRRAVAERDGHGGGRTTLTAPIPGRVLRLAVKPGDAVKKRQSLVALEAMKMENDIQAPRDGVVARVAVTEGESVAAGQTLLILE